MYKRQDECYMTVDEIVVEISVCVGSAVCGNEELRTVKIRGADPVSYTHLDVYNRQILPFYQNVQKEGIVLWKAA